MINNSAKMPSVQNLENDNLYQVFTFTEKDIQNVIQS